MARPIPVPPNRRIRRPARCRTKDARHMAEAARTAGTKGAGEPCCPAVAGGAGESCCVVGCVGVPCGVEGAEFFEKLCSAVEAEYAGEPCGAARAECAGEPSRTAGAGCADDAGCTEGAGRGYTASAAASSRKPLRNRQNETATGPKWLDRKTTSTAAPVVPQATPAAARKASALEVDISDTCVLQAVRAKWSAACGHDQQHVRPRMAGVSVSGASRLESGRGKNRHAHGVSLTAGRRRDRPPFAAAWRKGVSHP